MARSLLDVTRNCRIESLKAVLKQCACVVVIFRDKYSQLIHESTVSTQFAEDIKVRVLRKSGILLCKPGHSNDSVDNAQ